MSALGYGLVLIGLAFAAFGAVLGIWSGLTRRESLLPMVRMAIYGFSASMLASNAVMIAALLNHDFSVKYVAQVGSRSTPVLFTIVSLWSALEGSILFWGAILGAYLLAFTLTYRKDESRFVQLSLGVMAAVATFFAFLIAGPANPWTLIPNPLADGPGPNPLLQNHILMIIHPPMLYLGYVGMTVPFGIAAGALLRGELSDTWLVPLRKWTLIPFTFLSVGIILGSWWAYAVLGWGGYWAWDPVENASLLPWLCATAFLHSTMVLERKKMLKLWTVALALGAFLLTIIGTFMTRSGVFNSVHSFTQSDIGPTFLWFIAAVFVFSVLLVAWRGPKLVAEQGLDSMLSREGSILLNNVVFTAITFTVFIGTTFPLITEALQNKRISVGEPYFNTMTLPFWTLMIFLMGVGPMLPWGRADARTALKQLVLPSVVAVLCALACVVRDVWLTPFAECGRQVYCAFVTRGPFALLAFALCGFAAASTLRELFAPAQLRVEQQKEGALTALWRSASRAPRRFGGYLLHLGIVAIVLAVVSTSSAKVQVERTVKAGETFEVGDVKVRFDGFSSGTEPHRTWKGADVTLLFADGSQKHFASWNSPRMNFYERSNDPVGSPAIHSTALRDVYLSLRAFDAESASFSAYIFPLVGWIWYSIPILVLGSLIALWPSRRRETAAAPANAAVASP